MCPRASVCAHMCAWVWAQGEAQGVEGSEALSKSDWQGWGCPLNLVRSCVCGRTSSQGALTAPANIQTYWR